MSKPKRVRIREKSKTCQYEKDRRNRINEHFTKLWEILPVYDASKPLSKIDILIEAVNLIKDLTDKVEKLLLKPGEGKVVDVPTDVLKKLQDRVKKLLLRNEQLAGLLKNAGIKVPSECGAVKKVKKAPKYANNISPEQAKEFQKELEKENQGKPKRATKNVKPSKRRLNGKGKNIKATFLPPQNCLLLVSQPNISNSCILLANPAGRNNQTVLTNSLLVKTPIASTSVKPSIFPTMATTLLVANGSVMPLIPTPKPVVPFLPTVINQPPIIVVSSKNESSKTTVKSNTGSKKSLRPLKRKPITLTTYVNKVPIPALSSVYNTHLCVKNKSRKVKVIEGKKKNKSCAKAAEKIETSQATAVSEADSTNNISKEAVVEPVVPVTTQQDSPVVRHEQSEANIKESCDKNSATTPAKPVHNFEEQYSSTCLKQTSKSFELDMNLPATELSNDIFASLQGCHNPESTSPTAAFLLAFPLVSSGVKVTDVIGEENTESHAETPNLLQIGTMDGITKPTQTYADSLTPNLLNFDNFAFFNSKEYSGYGSYYNSSSAVTKTAPCDSLSKPAVKNKEKTPHYQYGLRPAPVPEKDQFAKAASSVPFTINNEQFYKPPENYTNAKPICTTTTNQFVSNMYYPPVYTSANSYNTFNTSNYVDYNSKSYSDCSQKDKKKSPSAQIKPVNWMTTPTTTVSSYKPDYFIPPYTKESNFNQNSYFNSSYNEVPLPNYNLYQQRADGDDNQFSWSNTFVPSTLPTLVGDLALNNPPYVEKNLNNKRKNCDNPEGHGSSFLSVSQLVDKYQENAKISTRRSSKTKPKKSINNKNPTPEKATGYNISVASNLFAKENKQQHAKNVPSSYSAEALIGNQEHKRNNYQNKVPNLFNNDNNMVPYYPPVEESGNYFNTTSFQSGNFIPSSTSYIQSNNFYNPDSLSENLFQKHPLTKDCKKPKKRPPNDTLPSFDLHFLSAPAAVNSPILPDDFHTAYLPPTTLYSCKNPLYPKREESGGLLPHLPTISGNRAQAAQQDGSSTVQSGGTSLTNFNLSTIFPEINKGASGLDMFPPTNNKKNYVQSSGPKNFSVASQLQVPYSNKPIF